MRTFVLGIALVLSACGSSASPPEPIAVVPTRTPAPSAAPVPSATPEIPAAAPAPAAVRVSPETSRAVADAVREGRLRAHAGQLPEALAAFDRALALVPGQPRVLCEAGFVAHRAGDEAGAARRIDSALHVFGPAERVDAELRPSLAMCLYNRGLVAEAQHEADEAVGAFQASLALRPSATVSAALARAQASGGGADEGDDGVRVGGALVMDDLVRVTSLEALRDVLRQGMRGLDQDGESLVPSSAVTISVRATLRRPSSGAEITILDVDNGDESYCEQRLVIAERTAEGYRVGALQVGAQDLMVSEDQGDSHLIDVQSRFDDNVLVIAVSTATNEGSFDTVEGDQGGYCYVQIHHVTGQTVAVLCPADSACVSAPIAHGDSGADVYRDCEGSGERVPEADDAAQTPASDVSVRLHVEGDVVVVEGTTDDDSVLAPGRYPFDALDAEALEIPAWNVDPS